MKKVNVGIAGLGGPGAVHAENIISRIPNAELLAAYRTDKEKLLTFTRKMDILYTHTDYSEMLKNPELNAVVIVTPSHLHAEQTQQALEAGLHVFCDKPPGITEERCLMAEQAERHPDFIFMLGRSVSAI